MRLQRVRRIMTGHTHRQKGRNVAKLIREGGREARGCPCGTREGEEGGHRGGYSQIPLSRASIRVSLAPCSLLSPVPFLSLLYPSHPLQNRNRHVVLEYICGVQPAGRNIMPVFYCAIIPMRWRPTACEGEGIAASSVEECVYTLAHAIGFVTRSLYAVPGRLLRPVTKETVMIFEMKSEQLRTVVKNSIFLSSLLTLIYCKKKFIVTLILSFI